MEIRAKHKGNCNGNGTRLPKLVEKKSNNRTSITKPGLENNEEANPKAVLRIIV